MLIRNGKESDIIDILEIYNNAIINTTAVYAYEPETLEQRLNWMHQKLAAGYPVLVAEQEGTILGFATYGSFRAWPAYKYTIEHSIYVHQDYRRRGAGQLLLREIMSLAEANGYATLVAGIDANNEASIALHERMGFSYSGKITRAGYKFGQWLDLVFYQYHLDGPIEPTEAL